MALIPLCGKYGEGKFAIVDEDDYARVSQYKWYVDVRIKRLKDGSMPSYCHFRVRGKVGKGSMVALHRFVTETFADDVDHINENPLDNRKCNLQVMDHVQHAKKSAAKRKKNLEERKQSCVGLQVTSTSGTETSSNTQAVPGQL